MQLYNTLSRKKEEFKPIKPGEVKVYSCGPTVYDFVHIGNCRAFICADILTRYLEYKDLKVIRVMNLTDVDDKTIRGARKENVPLKEYTDRYKKAFFEDIASLKIRKADFYPEATKCIREIVAIVKGLMEKGYAYKGDDGSIYYSVKKFRDYGKLANLKLDELQAGARVKQDEYDKEQANDFALWKAWDEEDGDVFWETEIGKGRPGWHIECSAMSMKHLGETFDIHTGGEDLIFPHHQNEIAQSEAFTGRKFVNYWFHNAFLLVNEKKMSKSLGNFYTLRDLIKKGYKPRAIRYALMSAHYRTPLNFTEEGIKAAQNSIDRLQEFIEKIRDLKKNSTAKENSEVKKILENARQVFENSMDDDLNINEALAAVFDVVRSVNSLILENKVSRRDAEKAEAAMIRFDKVLGLLEEEKEEISPEIKKLIEERNEARENKEWEKADQIREKIRQKGYELKDTREGTKIKRI